MVGGIGIAVGIGYQSLHLVPLNLVGDNDQEYQSQNESDQEECEQPVVAEEFEFAVTRKRHRRKMRCQVFVVNQAVDKVSSESTCGGHSVEILTS